MPAKKKTTKKATRKKAGARRTASKINGSAAAIGRTPTHRESYAAKRGSNASAAAAPSVHCTLAPLETDHMLLPTNVVAEVVDYETPEPVQSAPEWFLGQIEWQNRQIPVFSYSALVSGSEPGAVTARARIMIVKSLTDSARLPYLGIVIKDIPRLVTVQPEQLVHTGDERKSLGVFCHVTVQDQHALIPDLERLTHLVTHAAFGVLPITHS